MSEEPTQYGYGGEALKFRGITVPKSKMIWWDESIFIVTCSKPRPNWWWRMWQYLLMGIRWEKV